MWCDLSADQEHQEMKKTVTFVSLQTESSKQYLMHMNNWEELINENKVMESYLYNDSI